ncbi:unnamed protein product [Victoria cruziana]
MDEAEQKIESLRAMLSGERSKSKIARQKADQLAARVYELETQLEIVNNQKQKAEKAAARVLSILRDGGLVEYSDEDESETERQATSSEYEEKKLLIVECPEIEKTEARSPSHAIRDEMKEGSHGNGSRKTHELEVRQKPGNFIPVAGSSPKRRLGKSCRQIKRRDVGSTKEQRDTDCLKTESLVEGPPSDMENGIVPPPCSETTPEQTSGEENCCAKIFPDGKQDIPPLEGGTLDSGSDASAGDEDTKMERILEQHTQFIDQCRSEESLQDQEETARYVAISNTVFPQPAEDPGSPMKAGPEPASLDIENSVADVGSTPETNSNTEPVMDTCVHDVLPKIIQGTAEKEISANGKLSHENERSLEAVPDDIGRDIAMGLASNGFSSAPANSDRSEKTPDGLKLGDVLRRDSYAALSKGKQPMFYVETPSPSTPGSLRSQMSWRGSSGNPNAVVASAPQIRIGSNASPDDLGAILKNLQLARYSLQSRLEKSSLSKGKIITPSDEAKIAEESMKLPFISCAGLFRVPPSLHDSETRFSSQSSDSHLVTGPAIGDQRRHHYRDSRFQISAGNVYPYVPLVTPSVSPAQPQCEDPYSRFAGFQHSHTDEQNRNFRY